MASSEKKQSTLSRFFMNNPAIQETETSLSPTAKQPLPALASDQLRYETGIKFLDIPQDRLVREHYIRQGPIREHMDTYPKTNISGKQRSFQTKWFDDRKWLEYSKEHDAAFCFPCRVFGKTIYDATFQKLGFRQWHRALAAGKGFAKHSQSNELQENVIAWQHFMQSPPIDTLLDAERKRLLELGNKERQNRHDVLPILFDVTNTLARLRLPFRGHNETDNSVNMGVFLEVVNLVSRWNNDLANHLIKSKANSKSYPSYTSPSSQNEMINALANIVRGKIVKNVKAAKFFTICLDTTPDTSKQDQLSIILRYVDKDGEINEDLLGLVHTEDMTASGLFSYLKSALDEHELEITNIRGQGYDGCSTMSGKYSGVQARVREVCPCAYFVHCYAHRLNLVIVDTCSKNTIVRNFFGVVESLYVFIEGSTKRHAVFKAVRNQIVSECEIEEGSSTGGNQTLHSLSTTRWSSRVDNCKALSDNIVGVKKTLEAIMDDPSYDRKTAGEAAGLMKSIDFEFCLTLTIMSDLLNLSNIVSKSLQSKSLNIAAAAEQVMALISNIAEKRTEEMFDNYWKQTMATAESIDVEFSEKRARKVSKRIDQSWQNKTIITGKSRLRVSLHVEIIDLLLSALRGRFSPEVMPLLQCTDCLTKPSSAKVDKLHTLQTFYPSDLDNGALQLEYSLFCHALKLAPHVDQTCLQSIYKHMVETSMLSLYPNIGRAYQLVLTLPVSSCSCERSFSALKFVKNSLRSTMTQVRLSDLMVLAVQAEKSMISLPEPLKSTQPELVSTDLSMAVDMFWNLVSRR